MTSRIREREAEFQKQVQDREEQITHLKDRLTILSQKLIESKEKDHKFPKDPRDREKVLLTLKEDGVELQNVLKQVCRIVHFEYSDVPNVANVFLDSHWIFLKGVSSKPSGKHIAAPIFCFFELCPLHVL